MKRKAFITAAIAIMLGGLWWQFKGSANSSADSPASPSATTQTTSDTSTPNTDERTPSTINEEKLSTDEDLQRCDPVQDGFGIVMKDWGKVRLPYADRWPKNEPGTLVDCSPDTDFGAAVAAAHALYLDDLRPGLIPELSVDTPGRALRLENHSGQDGDPNDLPYSCESIGWDKPQDGISVWHIYHKCDGTQLFVSPVRMRRVGDQWLMVYNIDGEIIVKDAPPDTLYFPFEGGD